MGKGQFKGHYYSQLDHARLMSVVSTMPATDAGVLVKLLLLAGQSRQQFDLIDGRLSIYGAPMKREELVQWLVQTTPGLAPEQANQALHALETNYKEILVSRAGIIRLKHWARVQSDSRSAGAKKTALCRIRQDVTAATDYLTAFAGTEFEVDTLMDMLATKLSKRGRKFVAPILEELTQTKIVEPVAGGLLRIAVSLSSKPVAPSALSPLGESAGPGGHEFEGHMITSDEVTCNHDQSQIRSEKRYFVSHDHDARAGTRANEVRNPPRDSLRASPGPRIGDSRGESAEGAALSWDSGGSRGIDIWAVSADQLPTAACKIFQPTDLKKTSDIFTHRLQLLSRKRGPKEAREIFCQTVQAVQSEVMSGGNLRTPEREVCARLNEAAGLPRRKKKVGTLCD